MINDNLLLTLIVVLATVIVLWLLHQLLMGLFMGDEDVSKVIARRRTTRATDDLTQIEGIGPKIEELLNAAGYSSFSDVADANPADLKKVLKEAGNRFKMHETKSWPKQARLARDEEWDKLEALQERLSGGR